MRVNNFLTAFNKHNGISYSQLTQTLNFKDETAFLKISLRDKDNNLIFSKLFEGSFPGVYDLAMISLIEYTVWGLQDAGLLKKEE